MLRVCWMGSGVTKLMLCCDVFFLSFFLESKQAAVQRLLCAQLVYESEQLEPPSPCIALSRSRSTSEPPPLNKVEMRSFLFPCVTFANSLVFLSFSSVGLRWPFIHPLHCCAALRDGVREQVKTCLDKQRKGASRDPKLSYIRISQDLTTQLLYFFF